MWGSRSKAARRRLDDGATCKTLQARSSSYALRCLSTKLFRTSTGGRAPSAQKFAGQLKYLSGSAHFLDLALQFLHSLRISGRDAFAHTCVDLSALASYVQFLRHASNLGSNGFNGDSQRGVPASMFLNHAHSTLAYLG